MKSLNNSKNIIKLSNINKSFGKAKVLVDINLSLEQGEFLIVSGESGSGKSTLLSLIGLLEKPSSGEYILGGQQTNQFDEYQLGILRNEKIGWIFQNYNLIDDITAFQNIRLPFRYSKAKTGVSNSEISERVEEIMDRLAISGLREKLPSQMSGGQQQRVCIARSLVMNPDLIVADEPTGNLDSKNSDLIFEILTSSNKSGVTIIMVTHSQKFIDRNIRQIVLKDGSIV